MNSTLCASLAFLTAVSTLAAQDSPFEIDFDAIIATPATDGANRSPRARASGFAQLSDRFAWSALRGSVLNPGNTFDVATLHNRASLDLGATVTFGSALSLFTDVGAELRAAGTPNRWSTTSDLRVDELGLTYAPRPLPWIKIGVGRTVLRSGYAYAFNTFSDLEVEPKLVRGRDDLTVAGVDLVSLGLYLRNFDTRLLYAPPSIERRVTDAHRAGAIATIDLGGPIVAGHLYTIGGESWATGVSASLALGSDTIVYSDTRLGPRTRPVTSGRIGAGPPAYERAETSPTTLSGAIIGVSASPHRLLDVIGELYLDTGGYTAEQLRDYTHLKARVRGAYDLAPNPAVRRYYRGVMAELLQSYDPFTSARVLLFLRLAPAATGSGVVQGGLSAFLDPLTISALVSPQLVITPWAPVEIVLGGDLSLGHPDSLFGQLPSLGAVTVEVRSCATW